MTVVVMVGSGSDSKPLDVTEGTAWADVMLEVIGASPLPLPVGIPAGTVVGLPVCPEALARGVEYDGERVLA